MTVCASEWGSSNVSSKRNSCPVYDERKQNQQSKSKVGGLSFPRKSGRVCTHLHSIVGCVLIPPRSTRSWPQWPQPASTPAARQHQGLGERLGEAARTMRWAPPPSPRQHGRREEGHATSHGSNGSTSVSCPPFLYEDTIFNSGEVIDSVT